MFYFIHILINRAVGQFNLTAKDKLNIERRAARFGEMASARSEPLQLSINSYAVSRRVTLRVSSHNILQIVFYLVIVR